MLAMGDLDRSFLFLNFLNMWFLVEHTYIMQKRRFIVWRNNLDYNLIRGMNPRPSTSQVEGNGFNPRRRYPAFAIVILIVFPHLKTF